MFVTGSTGSFVAGDTGNLASEVAVHFVAVVGFSFWLLFVLCLSAWNTSLTLVLMVTIPILLYIFTNGANQSQFSFLCL